MCKFLTKVPIYLLMDPSANMPSVPDDTSRGQADRLFASMRWIAPSGSAAAALTIYWLQQGLVDSSRLRTWVFIALFASISLVLAIFVPFLERWKTRRQLPVITEVGHALVGISAGSLAFVDPAALGDDRSVQMSVTSYVFATTLGLTRGVPSLGPLVLLALIPMWVGMVAGFAFAGSFFLALSLAFCALLIAHGVRQDRRLWAEIIELRTAAKAEAERRRFEAHTDSLTGLVNRAGSDAQVSVLASQELNKTFAVLYIDLDRFKPINDTYGHASGDVVLKEVAARLRSSCRQTDVVARIGGDEFMIVLQNDPSENPRSSGLAQRIAAVVSEPISLSDGVLVSVTASVGLAEGIAHNASLEEVVARADRAMYQTKIPEHRGERRSGLLPTQQKTQPLSRNSALSSSRNSSNS